MAVYKYGERVPKIGRDCYISDSARVIGDVTISDRCYIGHGAIIRGDYGKIIIGPGTAVEENATLHIRPHGTLELEESVTVGHGAIIHGKRINSHAVIGIGSIIGFDVVVGSWSIIAEGCVIPQKSMIPDNKIAGGVPYKIIGDVEQRHKDFWSYGKQLYVDLAREYPDKLKKCNGYQMQIPLDISRHCIETAAKKEYEHLVRTLLKENPAGKTRVKREAKINALKVFP
jgi:carbonic anhydrase/acetyltransferase-like protein (isoleucine patch superfamily)